IGPRETQLGEEDARERVVVVLAGVDQQLFVLGAQRPGQRGGLDELWTIADDGEDFHQSMAAYGLPDGGLSAPAQPGGSQLLARESRRRRPLRQSTSRSLRSGARRDDSFQAPAALARGPGQRAGEGEARASAAGVPQPVRPAAAGGRGSDGKGGRG